VFQPQTGTLKAGWEKTALSILRLPQPQQLLHLQAKSLTRGRYKRRKNLKEEKI
jgi:hypothetical protein